MIFIYVAVGFLISALVAQVVWTQRERKRMDAAQTRDERVSDVISLDEEESHGGQEPSGVSKLPQMILLGLAVMFMLSYFIFSDWKPGVPTFPGTYEEMGARMMGEYLGKQYSDQAARVVIVVNPAMAQQVDHPMLKHLTGALQENGTKLQILPIESTLVSGGSRSVPLNYPMTADKVKEIMNRYRSDRIHLIISLAGFDLNYDPRDWPAERPPFIAVFADTPNFEPYTKMVKRGHANYVVMSCGTYPPGGKVDQMIDYKVQRDYNFLSLTHSNVQFVEQEFRPMILRWPMEKNLWLEVKKP